LDFRQVPASTGSAVGKTAYSLQIQQEEILNRVHSEPAKRLKPTNSQSEGGEITVVMPQASIPVPTGTVREQHGAERVTTLLEPRVSGCMKASEGKNLQEIDVQEVADRYDPEQRERIAFVCAQGNFRDGTFRREHRRQSLVPATTQR
jgi:hypothetical protein